jgi:hypothetical protein
MIAKPVDFGNAAQIDFLKDLMAACGTLASTQVTGAF